MGIAGLAEFLAFRGHVAGLLISLGVGTFRVRDFAVAAQAKVLLAQQATNRVYSSFAHRALATTCAFNLKGKIGRGSL